MAGTVDIHDCRSFLRPLAFSKLSLTAERDPRLVVWDLFSGCGGTSAGLRDAGLEIALGVDNDPEAARTFRINFPEASFIERDIKEVKGPALDRYADEAEGAGLVLAACAPCQPFSKQNRRSRAGDARIPLLKELYRFVLRFKPHYVFVENVPGMQHGCLDGRPFQDFVAFLRRQGYGVSFGVIQALAYGVPQHRQRLILTASLSGEPGMPPPTHGPGLLPFRTVGQAIGHYPPLEAGGHDPAFPNHWACSLSPLLLARLRATPEGGGRMDWPDHLRLECHRDHDGHSDVYGRLHGGKPSVTLTTRCISLSNGRFGHPVQDRALSAREAAALQTFPDSFVFEGGMNSIARQIGNAVSVRLAKAFGEHFLAHWRGISDA